MAEKKVPETESERQARIAREMADPYEYLGPYLEAGLGKPFPIKKSRLPGFKFDDGSEPPWAPEDPVRPSLPEAADDDDEEPR